MGTNDLNERGLNSQEDDNHDCYDFSDQNYEFPVIFVLFVTIVDETVPSRQRVFV